MNSVEDRLLFTMATCGIIFPYESKHFVPQCSSSFSPYNRKAFKRKFPLNLKNGITSSMQWMSGKLELLRVNLILAIWINQAALWLADGGRAPSRSNNDSRSYKQLTAVMNKIIEEKPKSCIPHIAVCLGSPLPIYLPSSCSSSLRTRSQGDASFAFWKMLNHFWEKVRQWPWQFSNQQFPGWMAICQGEQKYYRSTGPALHWLPLDFLRLWLRGLSDRTVAQQVAFASGSESLSSKYRYELKSGGH